MLNIALGLRYLGKMVSNASGTINSKVTDYNLTTATLLAVATLLLIISLICFQCSDSVGCSAGRASGP